jgi:hypothetical protein
VIDQILVEVVQAGYNTLCSKICRHINFILNKEELPQLCIQNGLKQGYALSLMLFNFGICCQEGPRKVGRTGIEMNTSVSSWSMLMMLMYQIKTYVIKKNTEAL